MMEREKKIRYSHALLHSPNVRDVATLKVRSDRKQEPRTAQWVGGTKHLGCGRQNTLTGSGTGSQGRIQGTWMGHSGAMSCATMPVLFLV